MEGIVEKRTWVLIADDGPHSRSGLRALLASWPGIEVAGEASDGLEAVRLAGQHQPDVVLMDVRMPLMDGLEATRSIKNRWPAIRVVVLSMSAQYRADAIEAGADGFVVKGSPTNDLFEAVVGRVQSPKDKPRTKGMRTRPVLALAV
jgi:DNA-binding NarL/FixJ family response regulator